MSIYIIRGAEAHSHLEHYQFRAEWSRLCRRCPWATPFQGPDFCSIWYGTYRSQFEPLLVLSRDEDCTLNGILPLAVLSKDGGLVVAGAWQAEYQAWVCPPDLSDEFIQQAVRCLQADVPRAVLTFRYLPPGTPTSWLAGSEARRTCRLDSHRRPLFRLGEGEDTKRFFKNKTTKNQFNRLKKMGPLEFKRISDLKDFETLFGEIIRYYDFRQAAVHGVAPFQNDELKKPFHLAMMETAGLLHTTVLRVGDQIAAAHLGVCGNAEVHLGITVYSPFLAKLSPGKFHIHFLAEMLREEHYEQLDLTPGGDPYKDRFANGFDEVHTLTIFFSPRQRTKEVIRERLTEAVKKGLRIFRIEPKHIRSLGDRLKRVHAVRTPASLIRNACEWTGRCREMRIYSYDAARVRDFSGLELIRSNALEDLLGYQPAEGWQSRQRFLSTSLHRIENGLRVYTYTEDGNLLHYGWLIERQEKSFVSEVRQEFTFPPNSACLFDFYTFPHTRGRGLYSLSLRKMLQDAARIPGTDKIFISVLADNAPSRHVIEKVGFVYECSLFEKVRFGRAQRWSCVPETRETNSPSRVV